MVLSAEGLVGARLSTANGAWLVTAHLLGRGGFANVFRAYSAHGHSVERAAIKAVDLRKQRTSWAREKLKHEQVALEAAQTHPNIVRFYGALVHGPYHIFVFEGDGIINDWSGDYTALREFLRRLEEERESAKALTGDPDVNPLDLTEEEIAEAKARAEEERKILKEANNAPKVIEKIEAAIAVLEGNIEEIDARLMDAGSDVSKAQEIQVERDAKASKMQLYYDEWERLEGVLARAEEIRAAQEVPA